MEAKLKLLDHALKLIGTIVVTLALSKLSNMESSISTLNQNMATIIERTVNQSNEIKENRDEIRELRQLIMNNKDVKSGH